MQQFQNFYPAQQMPMYQNNYQPMQNPYMDRLNNLQQFQQSLQQPMVPAQMSGANQQLAPLGKIVESIEMVKATDIPMDGNMYYFPTADGSSVFGKQWLANGQTRILTFKPDLEDNPNNLSSETEKLKYEDFNNVLISIQNDLQTLNEKIDKISKPNTTKTKKEGSVDE